MIGLLLLWETLSINIAQEACCTPSKKIVVLHPYIVPPHNGPPPQQLLSSVPEVAIVERFDCISKILS